MWQEQARFLQLSQRGLDGLVVDAQIDGELMLSGQGAPPAPAQDLGVQMLGHLIGDGQKAGGAHGDQLGRFLARWQNANAL